MIHIPPFRVSLNSTSVVELCPLYTRMPGMFGGRNKAHWKVFNIIHDDIRPLKRAITLEVFIQIRK